MEVVWYEAIGESMGNRRDMLFVFFQEIVEVPIVFKQVVEANGMVKDMVECAGAQGCFLRHSRLLFSPCNYVNEISLDFEFPPHIEKQLFA
jgi:hypothetical protein